MTGSTIADFYVSPTGDDSAAGSQAHPFATLARALRALRPGETLLVRGGDYTERIMNPRIAAGRPNAAITVRSYPGERPVLHGLLWLSGADYWVIDGLNVTWNGGSSEDHMVRMLGGTGWSLRNMEIWGAHSYAALLIGAGDSLPSGWSVIGNCIHDTIPANGKNQDHNIYVNTGLNAGPGLIERNLVFGAPNGENIKLAGSESSSREGSANVIVRYNTLYDAAQPILIGGGSTAITIDRNIIGKGRNGYLVRGFDVSGRANAVSSNVGFGADEFIRDATGRLKDVANVLVHDASFDAVSCGGFHPRDAALQSYGRYAP